MPSNATVADVRGMYRAAVKTYKEMKRYSDQESYFAVETKLKDQLEALLREQFLWLHKPQLAHFLSMCSAHRPRAPHEILTRISMKYDELMETDEHGKTKANSGHA